MVRTNKGFTLVELMVVIVIIGVLAALAIPKFTEASTKAKLSEIPTVIGAWDHAVVASIAESGVVPDAITDLVFTDPESKWFGFAMTGGADAAAVYTATVRADISVGDYDNNTAGATSTINSSSQIVHDAGGFDTKYFPNFEMDETD
jgi:prepilin-type N-terminal cleavage/methylation domain-containing protein